MFPGAINSIDANKKVSELWEDEKKYRWWIIGFAVSLFILFVLHLSLFISAFIFETDLINHFTQNKPADDKPYDPYLDFRMLLVNLGGLTFAMLICLSLFSYSVFKCYKLKTFEKLDSISSFFLGLQVFFTFFSLIQTFIYGANFSVVSGSTIMLLSFILKFLLIPVWLLLSREVKKIKRIFFMAKRQEEIKAFYEANGQVGMNPNAQFQQQSPFGFPFQKNQQQANNQNNPIEITPDVEKKTERFTKLQLMTTGQLRKLADKLSISGNKEMKKPELINTIIMVSQSLEVNKTESKHEVDSDKDINSNIKN